jgi:hypothetical protein
MAIKIFMIKYAEMPYADVDGVASDIEALLENETCNECAYAIHVGDKFILVDYVKKGHILTHEVVKHD